MYQKQYNSHEEPKKHWGYEYLVLFVGQTLIAQSAFPEQFQWLEHLLAQVGIQ